MNDLGFASLLSDLKTVAEKAFTAARAAYPKESICGYALYADADASTVSASVNTLPRLWRMQADGPDDSIYYKWSPGEWAHEDVGSDCFYEWRRKLGAAMSSATSRVAAKKWRDQVHESCVQVLEQLDQEGFFGPRDNAVVLVFAVSDHEDPKNEKAWIKRLNSPSLYKEFASWIDSQ